MATTHATWAENPALVEGSEDGDEEVRSKVESGKCRESGGRY